MFFHRACKRLKFKRLVSHQPIFRKRLLASENSRACKPWFFIAYQNVVFRHQLLERFHDVVEQIVHHIVVVLPGPVGQMTGAEHDDCVVAAGFEVAAMRQDSFVRLDHL